jgi:hypothetical protein
MWTLWITVAWQHFSQGMTVKGPREWMELMMICCGMTMKKMGKSAFSLRKMKAMIV